MKTWIARLTVVLALYGVPALSGGRAQAAPLELSPAHLSQALVVVGETAELHAVVRNTTEQMIEHLTVDLLLPEGWAATPVRVEIPALAPLTAHPVRFLLAPQRSSHGPGRLLLNGGPAAGPIIADFHVAACDQLPVASARASLLRRAVDELDDGTIYVATGSYIVFLPRSAGDRGPALIYVRRHDKWHRVATLPAMGRVIWEDDAYEPGLARKAERWVYPQTYWIPPVTPDSDYLLTLKDTWTDERGRDWMAKMFLAPTDDPRVIKCTQVLWCSRDALVYRFEGPMLSAGDGTFGAARGGLHLPAAHEDLAAGEPVLYRSDRVDRGALAVAAPQGGVIGLLWDNHAMWAPGHAEPHALMASPNLIYEQDNHYLSLVVPRFDLNQPAAAAAASTAFRLPAKQPIYLRSELFITDAGGAADILDGWEAVYGGTRAALGRAPQMEGDGLAPVAPPSTPLQK